MNRNFNNKGNNNYNNRGRYNNKQRPKGLEVKGTSITIHNEDVNGAIRRLKKILENDNRQKTLASLEFYEKPSAKRKRVKESAKRKVARDRRKGIATGETVYNQPSSLKFMKSKRKRRKHMVERELFLKSRRR